MDEDKLNALANAVQECKSDCLALAAEVDSLQAQLIALREMIEDRNHL